jgi:hypothetical protein
MVIRKSGQFRRASSPAAPPPKTRQAQHVSDLEGRNGRRLRAARHVQDHRRELGIQYRSKDLGDHVVSGYQADIVDSDPDKYSGILYEERAAASSRSADKVASLTKKRSRERHLRRQRGDRQGHQEGRLERIRDHRARQSTCSQDQRREDDRGDGRQRRKHAAKEGILALQVHMGPAMTVQFKEIRLTGVEGRIETAGAVGPGTPSRWKDLSFGLPAERM